MTTTAMTITTTTTTITTTTTTTYENSLSLIALLISENVILSFDAAA